MRYAESISDIVGAGAMDYSKSDMINRGDGSPMNYVKPNSEIDSPT